MPNILITGGAGFIGKRVIYQLLEQGHEVYALVRGPKLTYNRRLHTIYGDINQPEKIEPLPINLDVAYYLIHSMGNRVENLIETEKRIAKNFISMIEKTSCKQIIFLGGIIEDDKNLSPHLQARLAVECILSASKIPCTILRSSIIIGAGSASFEIIRDLSEKLVLMIAPKWVKNYCQPIAICDVLFYLNKVLLNPNCFRKVFEIGGPEALTFKEALLRYATFRKLKRVIFDVPVLTPKLSSYWLFFITSVRFSICRYLVESMRHSSRKLNMTLDEIIPHQCLNYEQALRLTFQKFAQNEIVSILNEPFDSEKDGNSSFIEVPQEGCLKDEQVIPITLSCEEVHARIWSIGGDRGWYSMNWAWKVRGLIDRLVGGVGLNRGRKTPNVIKVGDTIDFWRVLLADEKEHHLILYAEIRLPGEAWLEFEVNEADKTLKQVATFRPKGLLGRLYWYLLLPIHIVIFKNMARSIASKI